MEPVLSGTLTDNDTEFDLDIRVQAVTPALWAEPGEKALPAHV